MRKYIISITILGLVYILSACSKMSNELQMILYNDSVCVYSNENYTNSNDNYFVIFVSKINYSKKYDDIYTKVYSKVNYPITKNECVKIPISVFNEKNQGYNIILDIGRTPDRADICIVSKNNKLRIEEVKAGQETCNS